MSGLDSAERFLKQLFGIVLVLILFIFFLQRGVFDGSLIDIGVTLLIMLVIFGVIKNVFFGR